MNKAKTEKWMESCNIDIYQAVEDVFGHAPAMNQLPNFADIIATHAPEHFPVKTEKWMQGLEHALCAIDDFSLMSCDEIMELIAAHAPNYGELVEACKAYRELNVCYHIGKHPSERLFERLGRANKVLALADLPGGDDDS